MAEYLIQDTTLDAIADAINAKTGGSSAMTPAQMVTVIGSISGGGSQGLFDLSFNFTDGRGVTTSGSVANNAVSNFTSKGYYSPPLLLKQPITINTGDVIEISFEDGVNIVGYTDVGLFSAIYYTSAAGQQKLQVGVNKLFPASGNHSLSYTFTGNSGIIVNALYYYKRADMENVSFKIHLKINGSTLF